MGRGIRSHPSSAPPPASVSTNREPMGFPFSRARHVGTEGFGGYLFAECSVAVDFCDRCVWGVAGKALRRT